VGSARESSSGERLKQSQPSRAFHVHSSICNIKDISQAPPVNGILTGDEPPLRGNHRQSTSQFVDISFVGQLVSLTLLPKQLHFLSQEFFHGSCYRTSPPVSKGEGWSYTSFFLFYFCSNTKCKQSLIVQSKITQRTVQTSCIAWWSLTFSARFFPWPLINNSICS